MDTGAIVSSPTIPWRSGWRLGAPAWGATAAGAAGLSFRTLTKPGEFAPAAAPAPWSFHLDLPAALGVPTATMLAGGFRLAFQTRGRGGHLTCLLTGSSVVCGQSTAALTPTLFSAEHEVHRSGDDQWIAIPGQSVALVTTRPGDTLRFCLAAGAADPDAALEVARSHLSDDADGLFAEACARRAPFWERYDGTEALKPAVACALETLVAHLRQPRGALPFRWSAAAVPGPEVLDANEVFALASAWCNIDAAVAEDIVKSVLSCQAEDGSIPAACTADGVTVSPYPAWPLLAQSAAMVFAARGDMSFLEYALPRLGRYAAWALRHYDPNGSGIHCWASAEEAFIPEAFDQNLASADLTAFLLCEIEALLELGDSAPEQLPERSMFVNERDRLIANLENVFWSPPTQSFHDRYIGGAHAERLSLSALMPLLRGTLPARFKEPLLKQLEGSDRFLSRNGAPLWLREDGDAGDPPIPGAHQLLLLEALRRAKAWEELARFVQCLSETLRRHFERQGILPDDLQLAGAPNGENPVGLACSITTSALAVRLTGILESPSGPSAVSAPMRWLDRHRSGVLTAGIGCLVLGVLAVVVAFTQKRTLPARHIEVLAGLARQHCAEGRYDPAIAVYRQLLAGTRDSPAVELLLANALFQKGDYVQAEDHYRSVLRRKPGAAPALMNLGSCLFRQGRLDEAAACYRQWIETFETEYPQLADKARTALGLISSCIAKPPPAGARGSLSSSEVRTEGRRAPRRSG